MGVLGGVGHTGLKEARGHATRRRPPPLRLWRHALTRSQPPGSAGELTQWADEAQRTNVLNVLNQIAPAHTPLVARMLGFEPSSVAARLKQGGSG